MWTDFPAVHHALTSPTAVRSAIPAPSPIPSRSDGSVPPARPGSGYGSRSSWPRPPDDPAAPAPSLDVVPGLEQVGRKRARRIWQLARFGIPLARATLRMARRCITDSRRCVVGVGGFVGRFGCWKGRLVCRDCSRGDLYCTRGRREWTRTSSTPPRSEPEAAGASCVAARRHQLQARPGPQGIERPGPPTTARTPGSPPRARTAWDPARSPPSPTPAPRT